MANEIYRCKEHANSVLTQMNELYGNSQFCDVTLVAGVDQTKISAHSFLLSACSQYFLKMFSTPLSESKNRKATFKNINGDSLHAIVKFLYTGEIELRVNTVESIFDAAHMMEIPKIVEACADFLLRRLDTSNCLGVLFLAELRNCSQLLEASTVYASKHFMQICKNDEFLKLNIQQLNKLIARDDLRIKSEEDIFNSVQNWIQHDSNNRSNYFDQLLKLIRLPLLNPAFLINSVKPLCITKSSEKLYVEAIEWNLLPERRAVQKCMKRIYNNDLIVVISRTLHADRRLYFYDPESLKWTDCKDIPDNIHLVYDIITWNDQLVLIYRTKQNQRYISILNLGNMSWTSNLLNIEVYHDRVRIALIEKYLYIIGDYYIKRWNTDCALQWEDLSIREEIPSNSCVVVLDNCLYFLGGNMGTAVKSYDPALRRWTSKAPTNQYHQNSAVATFNGFLYVFGANQGYEQTMERYDKANNKWTVVCRMGNITSVKSCVLYENKFMLIINNSNNSRVVQFFDPESNTFENQILITNNLKSCDTLYSAVIPNIMPLNIWK